LLQRAARAWHGDERLCAGLQRLARWLWWSVCGAATAYLGCVVLLLFLFRVIGERWWLLWPALYMPPQFALLPIIALLPVGLLLCPLSLFVDTVTAGVIVFAYMGFGLPIGNRAGSAPSLVVLTCNVGQRNNVRLTPLVEKEDPDIIVLQDAAHHGGAYARQYPERQVQAHGEFVLISRLPIRSVTPVEDALWQGHPIAARFELDWDGTGLVVFAVHMPTPRRELRRLMGLGLLKECARSRGWFGADASFAAAPNLAARLRLARALQQRIATEEMLTIVAGDLNMPHWGYMYREMASGLRDAYAESGWGCGFTFPGTTRNPVTLFGPWLRLDYILHSRGLRSCTARVEPASRAQHGALWAELRRDG
jgi:endonuclease/exonuclease/phosphatase (EEP) superfamily protein YafD